MTTTTTATETAYREARARRDELWARIKSLNSLVNQLNEEKARVSDEFFEVQRLALDLATALNEHEEVTA
jgi:hypothetical protein